MSAVVQTDRNKELVVGYHGECLDGTVAALAAFLRFGDKAEYRPLLHRDPPPRDFEGRKVILVDFAYSSKQIDQFRAQSVRVFDHHDTVAEDLRGKDDVLIDMERSGAGITWDQLHISKPRPKLVDYIEDDDLGRWNLPASKAVRCLLGTVHASDAGAHFDTWQKVMEEMQSAAGLKSIIDQGHCMYVHKIGEVKRIIEQSVQYVRFNGERIPAINSVNAADEICAEFGPEFKFVLVWHGIQGGRYKYALRTCRDDVNVGNIAKEYGGGGRKLAAAFYSERQLQDLPGVSLEA